MRRNVAQVLAIVAVAMLTKVSPAQAQYQDAAQMARRLAELEQQVAQLQGGSPYSYASHGTLGGGGCGGCGECDACGCCDCECEWVGKDFYNNRCRVGGLIGGAEIVFLRPYATEDALNNGPNDFGFVPSWRTWVGFVGESGLGSRIRYWEFDRGETDILGGTAYITGLEFRTLDFEITQQVDFRRWQFLVSGGLRYAETEVTRGSGSATGTFNVDSTGFDGIGLVAGIQASRDLSRSGALRLVTGARWSAMYGNTKFATATVSQGVVTGVTYYTPDRDDLRSVLELSIGPQFRRELANGATLFATGTVEAQYWHAASEDANDTQDLGFIGFGSAIGITR